MLVSLLSMIFLLHGQGFAQNTQQSARDLLSLTNQDRAAHGLGPLRWSPELAQAARQHDQQMVQRNALEHQFRGEPDLAARAGHAGAHFRAVAENIALGPDVSDLERQWMHSPPHRANILDPEMDSIGIALIRVGSEIWAVEDFSHAVPALGPSELEGRVIGLLAEQGMRAARATEAARQTCALEHGSAGGPRPRFIMRWEGSDLNRLPDVLIDKLRSGQFRSAAVGVCGGAHPGQGFTTYRVAVLLY
ncbi:MAG TPA: CAP domain-containing protein [Acidobacteriaceae bacterium]